jgi:3D (Asp-Asp-Asp) domain-containing protein
MRRVALVIFALLASITLSAQSWTATAYCKGTHTATGLKVRRGMAAADPRVLPLGSIVRVDAGDPRWDGIYSVQDTGPAIKGRILDLYFWSCYEALEFGRRPVEVEIIREGWAPSEAAKELR